MNKIAAGYRFTFDSTDIRGDNSYSIIKEGVSEKQAYLFADISNFIVGGSYFETLDSEPEWRILSEQKKIYAIIEKYKELFTEAQLAEMKEDIYSIIYYISEHIVGISDSNEFTMRVLKSFKVEHIPQDITIEDVTYHFTK